MEGADDWILELDTSGDVHVANPTEGVYVFYTENAEEYIRTDHVVNVANQW